MTTERTTYHFQTIAPNPNGPGFVITDSDGEISDFSTQSDGSTISFESIEEAKARLDDWWNGLDAYHQGEEEANARITWFLFEGAPEAWVGPVEWKKDPVGRQSVAFSLLPLYEAVSEGIDELAHLKKIDARRAGGGIEIRIVLATGDDQVGEAFAATRRAIEAQWPTADAWGWATEGPYGRGDIRIDVRFLATDPWLNFPTPNDDFEAGVDAGYTNS